MIQIFRTYSPFAKTTLKSDYFAYRSRFLLWAFANCVSFLAQLLLWKAVYNNSTESIIKGYSFNEMISYIGISKIVECMSFASIEKKVSNGIRDGDIANSLIKPINYKIELLFNSIGQIIGSTCLFFPLYLLVYYIFCITNHVIINFELSNVLLFPLFILIAFMLNYYISLISSAVIIKSIKHSGVYLLKKTIVSFLAGSLFPTSFYPVFLRKMISYMPFVYLRFYPTIVLQGKISIRDSFVVLTGGFFWVLVTGVLASILWNKMIRMIESFGG